MMSESCTLPHRTWHVACRGAWHVIVDPRSPDDPRGSDCPLSLTALPCSGAEQPGNFLRADSLAGLQCHDPPYTPPFEQVRSRTEHPCTCHAAHTGGLRKSSMSSALVNPWFFLPDGPTVPGCQRSSPAAARANIALDMRAEYDTAQLERRSTMLWFSPERQ